MTLLEAEDADALHDLVNDCEALGIRRRLLLMRLPTHISRPLRPAVRRLMMERLAPFAAADRVRLFRLAEEDLAVSWRDGGSRDRLIEQATDELRSVLAGLAKATAGASRSPKPSGARLLVCQLPIEADRARRFLDESTALHANPPAWQPAGQALNLRELGAIEKALAMADVARFVRRHRLWDLGGASPAIKWEHRRLDLADLAATLSPGTDLAAEPWLLRRLTRTLDRRMLALLSDPAEIRTAQPFMIDLAVTSILDPAFRRFDEGLPAPLHGQNAVRLSPLDLVDDPASFGIARDAARARGHRLVLAAQHPDSLSGFNVERIGVDYVELSWRALQGSMAPLDVPPGKIILADIPDARTLAQARARGISLVSGPGLG